MKMISLDASTKKTGWAYFEDNLLVAHGVLDSNIKENDSFLRMRIMGKLISELIDKYNPDYVVKENCQFQNNYNTFQQLSRLSGIILQILFQRNIKFDIVYPSTWRKYNKIIGRKRAEQKEDAIKKVNEKYDITVLDDEAEAILIGLWGLFHISI